MSPTARYHEFCRQHGLNPGPEQLACLQYFDRLQEEILHRQRPVPLWQRLTGRHQIIPVKGIYLWGNVGRGKTMLMDIFFSALDIPGKQRLHYHHFMRSIHRQLKHNDKHSDPLNLIAADIAKRIQLLCLDEFHVSDITDAMLLHRLLQVLFAKQVILVTTSNQKPDDLYADGLQRARFVPAIELIKQQTEVIELAGTVDYRAQTLRQQGTWHTPLDDAAEQRMQHAFASSSHHGSGNTGSVEINGREIPVRGLAEGTIWFDFSALCDSPRSQNDYIEIACENHTVLLSGLPALNDQQADAARRLLLLLDILYDHRVKLIVSAAAPIHAVYTGERLAFEFQRAVSRLVEMQSEQYLTQPHRLQQ